MPKFRTTIEGHPRVEPTEPLGPILPYASVQDVPAALRQALRASYDSGLTVQHLHMIYELPVEWLELIVREPDGSA